MSRFLFLALFICVLFATIGCKPVPDGEAGSEFVLDTALEKAVIQAIEDEILFYRLDEKDHRNRFGQDIWISPPDAKKEYLTIIYNLWPWGRVVRPVFIGWDMPVLCSTIDVDNPGKWPSLNSGFVRLAEYVDINEMYDMYNSFTCVRFQSKCSDRDGATARQKKRIEYSEKEKKGL